MKNMIKIAKFIYITVMALLVFQCASDDSNTQYLPPENPDISSANDTYLYNNGGNSLFERYNTATRWRWNDNFIAPNQRATPVRAEFVIPAARLIDYLWIEPYTTSGEGGQKLITDLFPAEIVFIGSTIFNTDGSEILGFAEGGARVTLLTLNDLDFQDRDWLTDRGRGILTTVHHEFSHIIQQNFGNPVGLNTISERYVGIEWINTSMVEAIKLGMVSPYGASTEFEDFVEIIAYYLVLEEDIFNEDYITQEDCSALSDPDAVLNCQELNEGRQKIKQKFDLIIEYYDNQLNIDLVEVKNTLQERLDNLIATGVIPD